FEGKGQPGEKVEIKDADGNVIGETEVNSDGTWDVVVTVPENGSVVVEAGDQKVEIKDLDVVAPLNVTSPKSGDTITDSDAVFEGTAQAGAVVVLKDEAGNVLAEATADQDGNWSMGYALPAGKATYTINTGGQVVTLADLVSVRNDTPEVAPLVVTTPKAGDQVESSGVDFAGTGEPGTKVEIKDADGNVIGETEVDGEGNWNLTVPAPVGNGNLSVVAGDETIVIEGVEVIDDTPAPVFEFAITSPSEDEVIGTSDIAFVGTGTPGAPIVITDAEGNELGSTVVDEFGSWTLTIPAQPEGANSITVNDGTKDIVFDFVVTEDVESTPLMDPLLGGSIAAGLLAFAGAFGLRRRFTSDNA
ncbi:Ig-like domain-containing protein, partial [Microbacterium sp. NPDC055988]|uniref:Ig-like domain-containing protein n=1 Tax=Microbacterium sp. NPDC055988 TaxID=3345671 RepID=UPI0035DB4633